MSEPAPAASIDWRWLQSFCRQVRFEPGDLLRRKGQHYRDMYLITEGCVDVDREIGVGTARFVVRGAGSPIGEIGFLRGRPALATVTAKTAAGALVIDDATLTRLEQEQPVPTAQLFRQFGQIAEERTSYNLILASAAGAYTSGRAIDVHLCRNKDMLESAQRLRYEVYCGELGRHSPYADHDQAIIADDLDHTGHTFIAVEDGVTIGTLRANLSCESSLGILDELYGMRSSAHHPQATGICTKFIVKSSKRGGPASIKLMSAVTRFGIRHAIRECYIDCIPALLSYYKAIGFTVAGAKFLHRENGPSYPMKLDLVRHGATLSKESGVLGHLSLIVKAQAIRLLDRFRGPRAFAMLP